MRTKFWSPLAVLLLLTCFAPVATAQPRTCAGVSFPATVTVAGDKLVLNGIGLREATFLNVDVYVAALYVSKRSTDPKALLSNRATTRVVIHFVRDASAEQVRDELNSGLSDNAPNVDERLKRTFLSWLDSFVPGDTLEFTYLPDKGLSVAVRGKVKGRISGDDFASAVLSTLIGPEPPNDGLKSGLLGGRCES